MKYLLKQDDSDILNQELSYAKQADRTEIRRILKIEQFGFCAYSERFIKETDSVEHFDPRLKNTDHDNYHNWFAVLSRINHCKPKKIEPFLPIAEPNSEILRSQLKYEEGIYQPENESNNSVQNLINFLGLNGIELFTDRQNHISRIRALQSLCVTEEEFYEQLIQFRENLSFATALEEEFNLELESIIFDG